jgi:hypothetical protein
MAQQWFVIKEGQAESGPFPTDQLRKMAETGDLKPNDRIRPQGGDKWAMAKLVKGLFPNTSQTMVGAKPTPQSPPMGTPVSEGNPFAFDDSPAEPQRASKSKEGLRAEDEQRPKKASPTLKSDAKSAPERRPTPAPTSEADDNPFSFGESPAPTPKPRKETKETDDAEDRPRPKSNAGLAAKSSPVKRDVPDRQPNRARDDDDEDDRRDRKRRDERDEDDEDDRRDRKRRDEDDDRRRGRDDDDDDRDRRKSSERRRDEEKKPRPKRKAQELKPRTITALQKTGEFDEVEYSICWNGIEEAELNADELILFCTTRTRHEVATGSKFAGILTGEKAAEPLYHLAILRSEIAVLYAPEDDPVEAIRFPFTSLSWQFLQGNEIAESSFSHDDLFATDSKRAEEDEDDTVILILKSSLNECTLKLFRGKQLKTLRETLVNQVMKQADALFQEGKYVLAERCLERIPEESAAADDAEKLRDKMGVRAAVTVDYRRGHPKLKSPARGILRADALGLEFFVELTGQSIRILDADFQAGSELRQGRYPGEFAQQIEAERKSARNEIAISKAASETGTSLMRNAAAARMEAAKKRFKSARYGSPFKNRFVIRANVPTAATIVFDVAGTDRETVQKNASTFHAILKRLGKAASLKRKAAPQLVGCPRCQATLRVQVTGVVQCPRCDAKVRVPQTESVA